MPYCLALVIQILYKLSELINIFSVSGVNDFNGYFKIISIGDSVSPIFLFISDKRFALFSRFLTVDRIFINPGDYKLSCPLSILFILPVSAALLYIPVSRETMFQEL